MKVPFQYQFFVLSDGRVSIIDTQMEALNFILLLLQLLYMTGKYVCCAYIKLREMVRSKRRLIHGVGHGPPGERFYCTDKRICPCVNYRCLSLHVCVLISMPVVVCLSFCTLSNIQRHRNVQKGSKMEIQITPDVNANSTI